MEMRMYRVMAIALPFTIVACGAGTPPVQTAASSITLFRGAGGEVRLRCGSESLRARLRHGQILAQVGNGESAVLVPVDDARAGAGPAYSDGKLTLYKVPQKDGWMLASAESPPAECRRETPSP
jgi:hypothetical protein